MCNVNHQKFVLQIRNVRYQKMKQISKFDHLGHKDRFRPGNAINCMEDVSRRSEILLIATETTVNVRKWLSTTGNRPEKDTLDLEPSRPGRIISISNYVLFLTV